MLTISFDGCEAHDALANALGGLRNYTANLSWWDGRSILVPNPVEIFNVDEDEGTVIVREIGEDGPVRNANVHVPFDDIFRIEIQ